MNITIDGTPGFGLRAIKRYTVNLIKELLKLDKENTYKIFYIAFREGLDKIPDVSMHPHAENLICRIPGRILNFTWDHFGLLKGETLVGDTDIYHCTSADMPVWKKTKSVMTLHGFHQEAVPEFFDKEWALLTRKIYRTSIQRADFFIAVSKKIKEEAVQFFSLRPEKIFVVPLGIEKIFCQHAIDDARWAQIKQTCGIKKPFLFFVGAIQPNKNIATLLKAFSLLKNEFKMDCQMVILGHKDPVYASYLSHVMDTLHECRLEQDVVFTDYISGDDDLVALYNKASAFTYPTFYEGWTSPPLEAMKCGCPVVTSNVSSLPETVGDAALKVNPHSPEEIAAATYKLLTDNALRQDLIQKGLDWSKQFTWERMAGETLSVYKHIYENLQ